MRHLKKFWVLAVSASFIFTSIVWTPKVEAGTLVTFCKNGANNCNKRKFFRLPAKKGVNSVEFKIGYYQGSNPIGQIGTIGEVINADDIFKTALAELSNVEGSSLKMNLGDPVLINTLEEGLNLLSRSPRNKQSVIIVDNSSNTELMSAFFNQTQVSTLGVGGILVGLSNGKIRSSFLIMNGARFLGSEADSSRALFTAMHELVHSIGISHTQIYDGQFGPGSEALANSENVPLMFPIFLDQPSRLTPDDKGIIRFLYRNKQRKNGDLAQRTTGTIQVKLLNNGQPVTGYMVIAYAADDPSFAASATTGFNRSNGLALIPVPLDDGNPRNFVLRVTPVNPEFVGGKAISSFETPNESLGTAGYLNGNQLIDNSTFAAQAVPQVGVENQVTVSPGLKGKQASKVVIDLADFQ